MTKNLLIVLFALLITGCTVHKPADNNGEHREPVSYDSKRSMGIYLFASGDEPFWVVDFLNSNDSTKIYILSDNNTLKFKTPDPVLDSAAKSIMYTFDSGTSLLLKKGKCKDNMSGEISDFDATLIVHDKNYKGCGKYIIATKNPLLSNSTLRLNDIWALRKIKGKAIVPSDFNKGVPVLELHLNDGRFLGNTNCNTISGSLDVGDSYISFSDFTSTKIFCEGDFEFQYLQSLKSIDSWTLDKMLLILRSKGDEVLVYQKVD